jgi:hypothetical protein
VFLAVNKLYDGHTQGQFGVEVLVRYKQTLVQRGCRLIRIARRYSTPVPTGKELFGSKPQRPLAIEAARVHLDAQGRSREEFEG